MTRRQRIETAATRVMLRPIKARKGVGRGRMSAATRDKLAALAMLIERQAPRDGIAGQQIVHIPAKLIVAIRDALEA